MKIKIIALTAILMSVLLTACSVMPTPKTSTPMSKPQSLPTFGEESSGVADKAGLRWKSARLVASNRAAGDTDLVFLAELENTGEQPVSVYSLKLDLTDENGKVLKQTGNLAIYPGILKPGEVGYVCELAYNNHIDKKFTADQVSGMKPEGRYAIIKKLQEEPAVKVSLTATGLCENLGFPNLEYQIVNNETKPLQKLHVVSPVFSARGELLSVIRSDIKELKAGETLTANQMAVLYDEAADYQTAVIAPFLHVEEQ